MKTVYFVRHGETDNNAEQKFNSPDTPLSETGEKQALEIANRCARLPIELIVTSTMKRAEQTASIISQKKQVPVESSDFFVEGRYTSRLFGMKVDDPEATAVVKNFYENFSKPNIRFEDGENFDDLKARALSGLDYLTNKSESNILVVSHALFMWFVVAAAIFGRELTTEECRGVLKGFDLMKNTGLTVLTYKVPVHKAIGEPRSEWQLSVWNDHAHLG